MLGLLGGGQLGRMFAMAAQSMGYRVLVLDPAPTGPASSVADAHLQADYLDENLRMSRLKRSDCWPIIAWSAHRQPAWLLLRIAFWKRIFWLPTDLVLPRMPYRGRE